SMLLDKAHYLLPIAQVKIRQYKVFVYLGFTLYF
ncbi:MAG: hypothetical protein ACJAXH_002295, partial [Colwellia sp.]